MSDIFVRIVALNYQHLIKKN